MRTLQQPGELGMHGRVVESQDAIGLPGLGI
jgi:hypothetical protein